MSKTIYMLGYASDIAGASRGSANGPLVLETSACLVPLAQAGVELHWQAQLKPEASNSKLAIVKTLCNTLGASVKSLVSEEKFFTVIGGDHSCAIGTWSGAYAAIQKQGPLGLIWIDAHMDSHTPDTSPSGNIHGMPLACLLGYGENSLKNLLVNSPKLKPEHVCLIGIRSFEPGEAQLLKDLNVRIFFMDEVKERGIDAVLAEALQIVQKGTAGFGLSIDIDAIDPEDAPGTGVAEEDGISGKALCHALQMVSQQSRFIGAEITEFDPQRDKNQKTEKLIAEMISSMTLGKS